jgi:hypothetical protein
VNFPENWKSRLPLTDVTWPKVLEEAADHVVLMPPNVTLLVTSLQSARKVNFTRSGVMLKVLLKLKLMLYLLGDLPKP